MLCVLIARPMCCTSTFRCHMFLIWYSKLFWYLTKWNVHILWLMTTEYYTISVTYYIFRVFFFRMISRNKGAFTLKFTLRAVHQPLSRTRNVVQKHISFTFSSTSQVYYRAGPNTEELGSLKKRDYLNKSIFYPQRGVKHL